MSEAFLVAVRHLVAHGVAEAEERLVASAHVILGDDGRRSAGQPGIALWGGTVPVDEDVVLRIWPERGEPCGRPPF